jgi:hypothetical protein
MSLITEALNPDTGSDLIGTGFATQDKTGFGAVTILITLQLYLFAFKIQNGNA